MSRPTQTDYAVQHQVLRDQGRPTSTGDTSQEDSIDPPPRGPEGFDQDRLF